VIAAIRVGADAYAEEWIRTHATEQPGPFKRLDLDLSGEQWGALLYD